MPPRVRQPSLALKRQANGRGSARHGSQMYGRPERVLLRFLLTLPVGANPPVVPSVSFSLHKVHINISALPVVVTQSKYRRGIKSKDFPCQDFGSPPNRTTGLKTVSLLPGCGGFAISVIITAEPPPKNRRKNGFECRSFVLRI